jgi:7-carboxy-7-deazaguanine synthase
VSRINLQEVEKQNIRDDGVLEVHSTWHTIQGEGPFVGRPAVFVRLTGCNLQCPACDTEYTSKRRMLSPAALLEEVENLGRGTKTTLVVITGGEPFRQNFAPFAMKAVYAGYDVQIETNGTLWFDEFFPARFSVVCSPKTPVLNESLKRYVTALKYVVKAGEIDPEDGLPTSVLENGLRPARPWPGFRGQVYIQPMDVGDAYMDPTGEAQRMNNHNINAAVEVCLKHGYRLCLQVHKIAGLP